MRFSNFLAHTSLALALTAPVVACGGLESTTAEDGVEAQSDDAIVIGPIVLARIAYRLGGDIHSMRSDGSDDLTLTAGTHPSYSDNRTRMAYAVGGAIKVVEAPFDAAAFANAITVYSNTGTWAGVTPSMSLDGTRVTFATAGIAGYGATLFVYTIGTNNPVTLIDGSGTWVYNPVFTADGDHIAYNVGTPSIVNGLSVRRVSRTVVNQPAQTAGTLIVNQAYAPQFSNDGTKLTFYRHVAGRGYDIFLANANGSGVASYAGNSDYDDLYPTFSSGGTMLAFVSKRSYVICAGQLCYFGNSNETAHNLWKGSTSGTAMENLTGFSSANTMQHPSWQ